MSAPLSMYPASVPVFIRTLQNLVHVLKKGQAHAAANEYAPELLLQARLAPDMLPLVRQVQIATDMVKNGSARLAGIDAPKFADDETTFEELHARIERAIEFMRSLQPEQIDGSETRGISLNFGPTRLDYDGRAYLLDFVLPNLFFHVSIAYAILRQSGVRLGKLDYMGAGIER
ncbi:DUF1993 domain-containing protein [Marilutibacter chinensis]|uniref:DUF1993 domain-containing protein n=1 Tax=Marilutibacter chinensis TaxID=2912247 RepID=A0ABS9HRY7_9GAMM|nr:DUF1993 domain-containing protein [Lysobacter chinensis]MCF7221428.1 DUF1993 domain-containing protein [Lysobacter chinensis]